MGRIGDPVTAGFNVFKDATGGKVAVCYACQKKVSAVAARMRRHASTCPSKHKKAQQGTQAMFKTLPAIPEVHRLLARVCYAQNLPFTWFAMIQRRAPNSVNI